MTPEEFEDFKDALIDIKNVYKDISEEQLLNILLIYVSIHKRFSREDLIEFVRIQKDLNNI